MLHCRKCVGCGAVKDRNDMIKITADCNSKEIYVNPNPKIYGRSAYLCYNENCINNAFKKDRISRALKKNVSDDTQKKIFSVLDGNIMIKH